MERVVESVDGIARSMGVETEQLLARLAGIEKRLARLEAVAGSGGEWMSTSEVARELGVTPSFVYEHQQKLGVHRKGDGRRPRLTFSRSAVEAYRKEPGGPNENAIRLREARSRRGRAA